MPRVHSALPDALTAAVDAAQGDVGHVAHGGPPVWLWRAAEDWTLEPERAL